MLDLLITNATLYDGVDAEPRAAAVGVRGDRVAHVGERPAGGAARETVDAGGLVLCPGFVDTHASTGLGYLVPRAADNKLFQGVTTEVVGNCGNGDAPIGPHHAERHAATCEAMGVPHGWTTMAEWLGRLDAYGLPINAATYVGHNTLRAGFCADAAAVTPAEQAAMEAALAASLAAGAVGLATGLVYAPGSFATTEEVVALARVAAAHGGIYASHLRNEREGLEAAVDEALEIGRRAGLPVLISHLKAAERPNWGKLPRIVERLGTARNDGLEVAFEVYPYTAVSTRLRTFLPKDILSDGVEAMAERLADASWQERCAAWLDGRETDYAAMTLITESLPGSRGASVEQLAARRDAGGAGPSRGGAAAVIDVLTVDPDAWIVYDCLSSDDLDAAVLCPWSNVCSDSWSYPWNAPVQIGDPHPRTFGAFARFLERYAVPGRLPFGEAVRKVTSIPADRLGFRRRGRVVPGAFADLVLLDPAKVRETATYADPRRLAEGVERVWVNGQLVLADGAVRDVRPGRVLRAGDERAADERAP